MNVLVLTTLTPFRHGRAEELTSQLVRHMKLHGVNAEAMRLPFKAHPPERLLDEMFIFKSLKLYNVDRVVSLAFPAELVPFESRSCWMLREYQQAYDYCETLEAAAGQGSRAETIKDALIRNETQSLQSAKHLFAGSSTAQAQIQRFHGLSSDLLLPPLSDPELFESTGDDGYILASGRIGAAERLFPLIDAMKLVSPSVRLVIAGQPENPLDAEKLRERVHEAGVEGRVAFEPQAAQSREALAGLVGRARAVVSLEDDADPSAGLFMEAFQASKPVLATTGWARNIVNDGEAGIVSEVTPEALADGMRTLLESPNRAMNMGAAGHERWRSLKVDWPTTVERLLA
ncbi:glycosyltransferase family 4 protein [Microvirga sp. 2YAF29]|uniref:glycosyltransferase family 4 protein n=1 Tax=Microvirga sp. 2YAF29 TaxID=3233031 RepID=UPI003F9CEC6C